MLFKLRGKDYTNKIIEGTYAINAEEVYTYWTDANYDKHRQSYKSRIAGSFTMYFGDEETYEEFVQDVKKSKTIDGSYYVSLAVNNLNEFYDNTEVFITFEPKREQKAVGKAWYPNVVVKIEGV